MKGIALRMERGRTMNLHMRTYLNAVHRREIACNIHSLCLWITSKEKNPKVIPLKMRDHDEWRPSHLLLKNKVNGVKTNKNGRQRHIPVMVNYLFLPYKFKYCRVGSVLRIIVTYLTDIDVCYLRRLLLEWGLAHTHTHVPQSIGCLRVAPPLKPARTNPRSALLSAYLEQTWTFAVGKRHTNLKKRSKLWGGEWTAKLWDHSVRTRFQAEDHIHFYHANLQQNDQFCKCLGNTVYT